MPEPQRLEDRLRDLRRIHDVGQGNEPDSGRERVVEHARGLDREPGLSRPAGSQQRGQPIRAILQSRAHSREILLSAEEPRRPKRQIALRTKRVELGEVVCAHRGDTREKHAPRRLLAAQTMDAEVLDRCVQFGKPAQEHGSRLGTQDLPGVSGQSEADHMLRSRTLANRSFLIELAGVQSHAHAWHTTGFRRVE